MGIQTFRARVAEHSYLAERYQNVHLELIEPSRLEFVAGQYVMMKVPGLIGVRQYSIVNPPSVNHAVELLVDVIPTGVGSLYLASLAPGDEVEFMAPAGKFVITHSTSSGQAEPASAGSSGEAKEEELWFVATGSGIAPMKSIISDLLVDKHDKRQMWLHWGLRYAEDVFWFSEFAELAEEYDNFNFDMVLSKPPETWELCRGHVTDCVLKHHQVRQLADKIGAYLCGSKGMIGDVKRILAEKGIPGERVHTEQFY